MVGHVGSLDVGHERKREIKAESSICGLSLWAYGLAIYQDGKDKERGRDLAFCRKKEANERKGIGSEKTEKEDATLDKIKWRKSKIRRK